METSHVHGLKDFILLQCKYDSKKSIYSMHPYKKSNSKYAFCSYRKFYLKIYMESRKTLNICNNLEKEQAGECTHLDFETYCKVTVIKQRDKSIKIDIYNNRIQ